MLRLCTSLDDFKEFPEEFSLSLLERTPKKGAEAFFDALMQSDFAVEGFVSRNNLVQDIQTLLADTVPDALKSDGFYPLWIEDMANISRNFSILQDSDEVCFWLGTKRGCKRFHIDYVPMRLLVTYAGYGTEWLPRDASDWDAYHNGAGNDDICKDTSKIETLQPWDVALFRGQEKGLLHKTPDHAICCPSIFMRLDNADHKRKLQKLNDMR